MLLATLFILTSCNDSDVWMSYNQTYCADEWHDLITDPNDETQVLNTVTDYLSEVHGITVLESNIELNADFLSSCNACNCTAGKTIKVKVDEAHIDELEDLEFFQ